VFQRAERKKAYLKLALTGPSGSGKTFSALQLAFGLGQRIALVDTENGSGSLYAHLGAYDTAELASPFTVEKYIRAIEEAVRGRYDVLILDSISHAWAAEGGLLDKKGALDARGGNQYTNWAPITKEHEAFKSALLQSPIHLIATMRSKTEYVVEQTDRGKSAPRKVGLAPIQRDGMEYEFTVVLDIAADHSAAAGKDRTGIFDGLNGKITPEHGRQLAAWLNSGADPRPAPPPPRPTAQQPDETNRAYNNRTRAAVPPIPDPVTTPSGLTVNPGTGEVIATPKSLTRQKQEDRFHALLLEAERLNVFTEYSAARHLQLLDVESAPDAELADAIRELEPLCQTDAPDEDAAPADANACQQCHKAMTPAQITVSQHKFGAPLCPTCQKSASRAA
jgi:hypothetical protein